MSDDAERAKAIREVVREFADLAVEITMDPRIPQVVMCDWAGHCQALYVSVRESKYNYNTKVWHHMQFFNHDSPDLARAKLAELRTLYDAMIEEASNE